MFDSGDGASQPDTDGAVPLDAAKAAPGSTTIQDPAMQSTTIHGTTLAAVAAAIPAEAGSVAFDFSVATQGDPATAATLTVTQTMTLPQWAERDTAAVPAQRSWDRFLDALTQHENGHVAIDKRLFANAHGRFVGLPASQVDPTSDRLRTAVQAQQDAFDTRTDHGRKGTPPTILDTTADAPPPGAAPSAEQPTSDLDPAAIPDQGLPSLQARLAIGPADDPYEREADAVADQVLRRDPAEEPPPTAIGRVQRQVQRACARCARTLATGAGELCPACAAAAAHDESERRVARKEVDAESTPASGHIPDAVTATLDTGGEPLDRAARADMEGRFGHDFSRVRVHADAHAAASAQAINALAYTAGEQVVFGAGRYAPHTESGRWLLAHELTHVIQQRGDVVAPLRAGGPAVQRDEDKKEDFDTEQRRLIRDAKTDGDVKDINPQAFHLASDDDRFRLIGILLNQGWVGPRDEYYLEHIWGSFGKNLQDAAHRGFTLWNLCIERGADLWNLAELGPLKDKFRADVAAKTREHLVKNRAFVQQEQQKLGLNNPQAAPTADQNTALAALKGAAKQVEELDHKQAALVHLKVGYNPIPNIGDSSVDMRPEKDRWTVVEFEPDAPPPKHSGPVGIEDGPMPTWEATNAEYRRLEAAIKGFAKKHPSIYALRRDNEIGTVASGTDDAKTRQTVAASLQGVLDHIATTEGKLADPKSTLPLDLHPIHQQLYATPGSPWQEPFGQGVAKQTIQGHEDARWWEELGVNALQLALFAVAELATGGAAVFFLALGAGVGVVRAEQSWESWQEKNAASKSGMSEETQLLESGEADAALITALLDTATAFLDLYSVGSAAVREAQGVKALEERLAAAEVKEATGAVEAEIKQKQNWEFPDSVTGEAHSAHATERGLEICSDPPCLIIPQRMRQRFNNLHPRPGMEAEAGAIHLDAKTETDLNGLIGKAQANSDAWAAKTTELNNLTAARDATKAQQGGKLTVDQFKASNQGMSKIREEMGTLQDAAQKLEENFGALAREHEVRLGVAGEPGMSMPHGVSDDAVRTSLDIGAHEPCADILVGNRSGGWIIAESKGDDLVHAIEQMENTEKGLLAYEANTKIPADKKYGGVVSVEYRIYPSRPVYDKLLAGKGIGLSDYGVDSAGLLTLNGTPVTTPLRGRNVKILPPPAGY